MGGRQQTGTARSGRVVVLLAGVGAGAVAGGALRAASLLDRVGADRPWNEFLGPAGAAALGAAVRALVCLLGEWLRGGRERRALASGAAVGVDAPFLAWLAEDRRRSEGQRAEKLAAVRAPEEQSLAWWWRFYAVLGLVPVLAGLVEHAHMLWLYRYVDLPARWTPVMPLGVWGLVTVVLGLLTLATRWRWSRLLDDWEVRRRHPKDAATLVPAAANRGRQTDDRPAAGLSSAGPDFVPAPGADRPAGTPRGPTGRGPRLNVPPSPRPDDRPGPPLTFSGEDNS